MKCQKCDRVATFHITEMTDARPKELHLCDKHAYQYLHQNNQQGDSQDSEEDLASDDYNENDYDENDFDAEEKKNTAGLKELTEDLENSDFVACPCCGIGLQDFRKTGRLGCANDYRAFRSRLEPLLLSVHGSTEHCGKRPSRFVSLDAGARLVRLRNELAEAIEIEDYELASQLRDEIKALSSKA